MTAPPRPRRRRRRAERSRPAVAAAMADRAVLITRRDAQAEQARRLGMATCDWTALGTSAQVVVARPDALPIARAAVSRVLDDIDRAASRFRDDSELSMLNASNGEWRMVSALFARALRVALDAAEWTNGLVDPTVGAALVDLGYDRTFELIDSSARTVRVRTVAG